MSNGKNYPVAPIRERQSVQLHNGGSSSVGTLIDNAICNLTKEQTSNLIAKAADAALHLEVKAREQNLDYVAGKKALEDHIDAFAMLDKQGGLTRQKVVSDIKTGAGNMRIESKAGATCFVATATYGDIDHPNVRYLRAFRDQSLAKTPAGRAFIAWYWRTGPRLARWVAISPILKCASRGVLAVIIQLIRCAWQPTPSNKR